MAAPTNAAKCEKSSCQPGAVHTWHIASFRCDAGIRRYRGHSGRRSSSIYVYALEHRRPASAQASRDDVTASIMTLAPYVGIAAALCCDPSGISIERVRQRHRVDGAQQMGEPRQKFGGPADRGFHALHFAARWQQPDAVL